MNVPITLRSFHATLCNLSVHNLISHIYPRQIGICFHINGIIQYGAFCIWLCSVRIRLLRLIHVIAFLYSSQGSHGKYTRVVCHSLL